MSSQRDVWLRPIPISSALFALYITGAAVSLAARGSSNAIQVELLPVSWGVLFLTFGVQLAWAHRLFRAAHKALTRKGLCVQDEKARAYTFSLSLLALLCAMALVFDLNEYCKFTILTGQQLLFVGAVVEALAFVAIVGFFISMWWTAEALVWVEKSGQPPRWHEIAGTFLQVLYLVVGVWFLAARIEKLPLGSAGR